MKPTESMGKIFSDVESTVTEAVVQLRCVLPETKDSLNGMAFIPNGPLAGTSS